EPHAAVGVDEHVIGGVEVLALPALGEHRDRAIVLVANDASGGVLTRDEAASEVEGVAVALGRRLANDADPAVVVEPAELPIVGGVAPDQVTADGAPGGALGPQAA